MSFERQKFLESIIDGVLFFRDEKIIFANTSACNILGYSVQELMNLKLTNLFPSKYYTKIFRKFIKAEEGINYLELELITKEGNLISLNLSISTFFSPTEEPMQKLILIRSISEIKKARQQGLDHYRLYAVNQLSVVLTRMDSHGLGPVVVYHDSLPFVDVKGGEEDGLLLKLSIFYLTAVGQGSSYATGLFGPLPVFEYKEYLAIVFPFFLKNPENPDQRAKGKDYFILIIIFPKQLESMFLERKRIKNDLQLVFEEIEYSKNLPSLDGRSEKKGNFWKEVKTIAIFGKEPGVPIEQRLLARKLAAITDLSTELNSMLELDVAFNYFASFAERVLDFKIFALLLVNESTSTLKIASFLGYSQEASILEIPLSFTKSVVTKCAREGKLINILNVKEIDYYHCVDTQEGNEVKSELAVPVVLDERVIGVINIESTEESAFSIQDERIMTSLAAQISTYLARREYERKLRAIYEMQAILVETKSLQDLYDKINHFASAVLKFPIFSINVLNKRERTINLVASTGYENPDLYKSLQLQGEKGIVRYSAVTGTEVICQDVIKDQRYSATDDRVRCECTIPIVVHNRVLGVLNAEKFHKDGISKDDVGLIRALAKMTGQFIIQKNLESQMSALFVLTERLIDSSSIQGVLENLLTFIKETFDYEFFSISFVDHGQQTVNLAANFGYSNTDHIESIDLTANESVVVKAAREGKSINIKNISNEKSFIPASSEQIVSELAVPFLSLSDESVLGVLNIESRFYKSFSHEDILILEQMGRIIAKYVEKYQI